MEKIKSEKKDTSEKRKKKRKTETAPDDVSDTDEVKGAADKARTDEEKTPEEIAKLEEELKESYPYIKKAGKIAAWPVKETARYGVYEPAKIAAKTTVGAGLSFVGGVWNFGKGMFKVGGGKILEALELKPLIDSAVNGYKKMREAFRNGDKK